MKRKALFIAILSLVALPTGIFAQSQNEHSQHMMPQQGEHGAMPMARTKTIMLGEQTVEGVKAKALLNDIGTMMAQMGRKENFHFMIMLADAKSGAAIDQGTVAVKITDPKTGQTGEAIPLMGMSGHFGADIILPAKGEYRFQVGSKLADGSKRQFTFQHTVQ
jgi:hypothetical protein